MRVGLTLLIGVLAGFLMLAVAGGLMVCAGAFDMAATVAPGSLEQRVAGMTLVTLGSLSSHFSSTWGHVW